MEKLLTAQAGGPPPKDVLLDVMWKHYRAKRFDEAARVASMVAPFVHPRLSCSSVTVKPSLVEIIGAMSDEELTASVDELDRIIGGATELATAKPKGTA